MLKGGFDENRDTAFQEIQSCLDKQLVDLSVRVFWQLVVPHVEGVRITFFDLIPAHLGQIQFPA